nr:flagellar hook assembly protein FlgD [Escherichia coli]EGD0441966.1 flagellar hook assembly protein FlgD [Escherichia coli]
MSIAVTTTDPTNTGVSTTSSSSLTGSNAADLQSSFLTLLVAQLKNQDPTNPMENNELTSQLAQISTVSGIEKLNTTLGSISGQIDNSQSLQASNLIGHGVMIPGTTVLAGTGSEEGAVTTTTPFGVELQQAADKVTATITDKNGAVVRTIDIGELTAGVHSFTWDGTLTDGSTAPNGSYNVAISASNGGTQLVAQPLQFALVQGVIRGNSGNTLDLGTYGTTTLDVIGNNIANSATYGFKSGTASFADMFAGSKVGLGVKVAGITQDFTDGTTTNTGRGLDVAISQNGFFRLVDSNGSVFYSRNGQFKLDENRNLVNMQGLQLTGYPATGTPPTIQQGANPTNISIPNTLMAAKTTTTASMQINLNSSDPLPTVTPFSASNADSYNKKGSVTVFDSQGNAHDMSVYFVKTGDNNWQVYTQDSSDPTGTAEPAMKLVFNANGVLTSNPTENITTGAINGADPATFSLSFLNSMQQNTGANNIVATTQNGYKPGDLVSYQINDDGTVVGNYSNEQTQLLGQIVLANFANNEGLASEGDNVWSATQSSGVALLGTAGTGNFGTLTNGALEASNVDLSKELVNMIVAQRNYQSNAQTIKTQDQILNTLVNLR